MTLFIKTLNGKVPLKLLKAGMSFQVLVRLHDLLDFKTFRMVRMQSIAEDIGTDVSSVSRAMKDLVRVGILERTGGGPRTYWRFSSDYGWIGKPEQYHEFNANKERAKAAPPPLSYAEAA